ncbi:MAG TPA: MFS transporter [Candidatus Saccharimonadales bacterium]|jgi:sugar phosphate permease
MNVRIKGLMLGNSFFILAGSILVPVYALFSASIGAGVELAGLLFATKFVANAFADLIVLGIKDRVDFTELVYKLSMAVRGAAWIYLGLFPSIQSLLIVQIITGLAEGFGTPAFSSLFADSLDRNKHMKEWAIWDLIKNPLIAVGSALSGWLVANSSFEMLFYIMGTLAIIGSFIPIRRVSVASASKKYKAKAPRR